MAVLSADLSARLFTAARNEGKARAAVAKIVVDALATLQGDAYKAQYGEVRAAYIEGRMASANGLPQAKCAAVLELKPHSDKKAGQDGYRSEAQHNIVRAAEKAWNRLAGEFAVVNPEARGGARSSKMAEKDNAKADAKVASVGPLPFSPKVTLPKCKDDATVVAFMSDMAMLMSRFEKENAKALTITTRPILENYIAAVKALATAAKA